MFEENHPVMVIGSKVYALGQTHVLPHLPALIELLPTLLAMSAAAGVFFVIFLFGLYHTPVEPQRWIIPRGARDPKTTDHSIQAQDGVVLRGISKGSGPTILLIHGAGGSSDIFSFLFKRFSVRGFRVIAFDLRGHGYSDDVDDMTPEMLAADLHAVLEHLDLRDATVIGYDLGGYAALALALHFPTTVATRVGRLVLLSSYAQTPIELHSWLGKIYMTALATCIMHLLFRSRWASRLLMRPLFGRHVSKTHEEEWRRAVLNCSRRVWLMGLRAGSKSMLEGLKQVRCPVAIIAGTSDLFCGSSLHSLRTAARAASSLEVHLLPSVGHVTPWEAPDSLFALITAHVAKFANTSSPKGGGSRSESNAAHSVGVDGKQVERERGGEEQGRVREGVTALLAQNAEHARVRAAAPPGG